MIYCSFSFLGRFPQLSFVSAYLVSRRLDNIFLDYLFSCTCITNSFGSLIRYRLNQRTNSFIPGLVSRMSFAEQKAGELTSGNIKVSLMLPILSMRQIYCIHCFPLKLCRDNLCPVELGEQEQPN